MCNDSEANLGEDGTVILNIIDLNVTSTDNCGIDSIFMLNNIFGCNNVNSTIQRTIRSLDTNGNISNCQANVTITDTHGYCCPETLNVNYNPIDSTNYYASDSIFSKGQIANGTNVNFRSTIIKIDTTFQVDNGGVFQVINEDCSNP